MKSDALLEKVIDSAELPFAITKLQAVLNAERPLREKFYDEITEDGKVEFINGKVFVQSPAKLKHIEVSQRLSKLLQTYVTLKQSGWVGVEKALICLTRNDYEPDLTFFGSEKARHFTPDQLKFPAPDWVCEVISNSTQKIDRGIKYEDYALHGVGEYWLVDTDQEQVEIHLLAGEAFSLNEIVREGVLTSTIIPGFSIPIRAIFDDTQANLTLKALLAES